MGFVDALCAMGRRELERSGSGEFADIDSFCQMPSERIEEDSSSKRLPGKELHVWLDVPDPKAECLNVRGIRKIEIADFWGGGGDDRAKKRRYLYRDPVSPAAAWRYSPLYKLGGGVANGRQALVGDGDWRNNKELRFFKLYNSMLRAFEEQGVFSPGSVDRIMEALVERVERLAELWSDKKRSYLLIFGASDTERFYYPVDTPAFLAHFRSRLAGVSGAEPNKKNKQQHSVSCGVCHGPTSDPVNMDKIFKFATFDKKSFLPGLEDSDISRSKVFPLCEDCYRLLSEGRNAIDGNFLDTNSIYGIKIYTIPELLMENDVKWGYLKSKTQDFLQTGLQNEPFLAERVLEQEDSLTYHFLFLEKPKSPSSQERLLLMVEDVPPSRLRRLNDLWCQTVSATGLFVRKERFAPEAGEARADPNIATLYQGVRTIFRTLTALAGKNEKDAGVLRDQSLGMLGCLLSGKRVDPQCVKKLVVSRLQGLCADPEWVRSDKIKMEKTETDSPKQRRVGTVRRWSAIVDFLYRANELTKNVQSVPGDEERQIRVKG